MTQVVSPEAAASLTAQPPVPARERLLLAASKLFCRFGINAVGIDAVVAEAATAKATLYKTFGSKELLVEAVLEREGRIWRDWFIGALNAGTATPLQRLGRIFPLLGEWFAEERFYGCPFINAIGEHDKHEQRLRTITLSHKSAVLDRIGELARDAGASDPLTLAHQIGLLIDGAIVVAMITRDPNTALLAGDTAQQLISAMTPARRRPPRQ